MVIFQILMFTYDRYGDEQQLYQNRLASVFFITSFSVSLCFGSDIYIFIHIEFDARAELFSEILFFDFVLHSNTTRQFGWPQTKLFIYALLNTTKTCQILLKLAGWA